ncbi:MAG: Hsp33 family molecular chaperone HslO [Clostridia bacterium]|nr:Hsp33 family molecular chaperone HslO [Clostridia bacterium]
MDNNDKIIKYLAYNGKVSITCANTTYLVEKARTIHDLTPTTTAVMGRVLTITSIMGADLKGFDESLTIQINGNGPIR